MSAAAGTDRRIGAALLRDQAVAVLRAWGMTAEAAGTAAAVLVDADLKGIDSHGISMLDFYEAQVRAGSIAGEPRVVRESAITALIGGAAAMGHPAAAMAMGLAIRQAEAHDVGLVAVRNAQHFAAAGTYAEMAVRRGLIALVSCSTRMATVVPTFGAEPMLGTNPFAFTASAGRHEPVILDMAASVVPSNRIRIYALQGKGIPPGWVVDGDGRDVTDAALGWRLLFERLGGGTPHTGGHKGYGLGLFAQILGSTLAGGSFSPVRNRTQRPSDPDDIGQFFLALNPAAFRSLEEFRQDLDAVFDALRDTLPADPAQPVLIPGDLVMAAQDRPRGPWRADGARPAAPTPRDRGCRRRALAAGQGLEHGQHD